MNPIETDPETIAQPAGPAASPLAVEFLRYLVVGGTATALDFATLLLLSKVCGWHYLEAAAVAFTVGTTLNYFLSIHWVFTARGLRDPRVEFVLFVLIGLTGLGINHLCLWLLTASLGLVVAKLVTTAVVLAWNFAARKVILFTAPGSPRRQEEAAET